MEAITVSPRIDITLKLMEVNKVLCEVISLVDLATSDVPVDGKDLLRVAKAHGDMNWAISNLATAIANQMVAKGVEVAK